MVAVENCPIGIVEGVKLLETLTEARLATISEPLADAFAAALLEVTAPAAGVTVYVPGATAVRLTVTLHVPFAGIVPPESASEPPFAAAVTVPPHVLLADGLPEFCRFEGYVVVKPAPLIGVLFGFV